MVCELLKFEPSIDRPFGFYLWDLFVYAVDYLPIDFEPGTFTFKQNDSNILQSQWNQVMAAIVTYYVVIFGGNFLMKSLNIPAIKLQFLFRVHNVLLTFISGLLLVLLVEQLFPILVREGLMYAICNEGSWTQPIVTLYYLNYLTKYYEFIDTVFLVIRRKPLTFLHTYHHGCTALLCFTQLIGRTSVSWVPIVLNLFVHVVMYWYYFLASCGIRVWWKEWVTRLQIIQFVIDLFFVYFASYTYFTSTYWPWMPNYGSCAGEEFAAIYGCFLLSSYLLLFISFYLRVYATKKIKQARARSASKSKVAAQAEPVEAIKKTGSKKSAVPASDRVTRSRKA